MKGLGGKPDTHDTHDTHDTGLKEGGHVAAPLTGVRRLHSCPCCFAELREKEM